MFSSTSIITNFQSLFVYVPFCKNLQKQSILIRSVPASSLQAAEALLHQKSQIKDQLLQIITSRRTSRTICNSFLKDSRVGRGDIEWPEQIPARIHLRLKRIVSHRKMGSFHLSTRGSNEPKVAINKNPSSK
jgi:hypothetical protein